MKDKHLRNAVFCAAALTGCLCAGCGEVQQQTSAPAIETAVQTETDCTADTTALPEDGSATESDTTRSTAVASETTTETVTPEHMAAETAAASTSRTAAQTVRQSAPRTTTTRKSTTTARVTTTAASTTKHTTTTTTTTAPPTAAADDMAELVRKYRRGCAVLLYSMDGTVLYSHREDTMISGASLIKLPYVYYCCTQIESGAHTLDESMVYTSKYYQGGAGVIGKNGTGKSYTVAELMDYALRYSDNIAYNMLVHIFGTSGFNDMTAEWGYSVRISQSTRFPSVSASFMKTAMQNMQQKSDTGECWQIAWRALNESSRSIVREAIGGTDEIAVKYGSIPTQYHETCYVSGETPYILVLLSGAVNYKPDTQFVINVAQCAARIVAEYQDSITTTTTETTTESTETTTTTTTTTTEATTLTESVTTTVLPDISA